MSRPYEEMVDGEVLLRVAPDRRHESICNRLHERVASSLVGVTASRLLDRRSIVKLSSGIQLCPDLAMVTVANGRLWLAAEVISSADHHADTVLKKQLYEEWRIPRLWMIDPRYDNLEVYHATAHGLRLEGILAGREVLREAVLPALEISVVELFRD